MRMTDTRRATCEDCGLTTTLPALSLHDCDIARQGGKCEDYPCCGHTDGDGCQTLPQHTREYWVEIASNAATAYQMFEPGSPEWEDALAEAYPDGQCSECGDRLDEWCDCCEVCLVCCPNETVALNA